MGMSRYDLDEVFYFDMVTHNPSTGSASDADSTPTWKIYEEDSDTEIQSGSFTKRSSSTGSYRGSVTLSSANGFEKGKFYSLIAEATVDSIIGKIVLANFQIETTSITEVKTAVDNIDISSDLSGLDTKLNTISSDITGLDTKLNTISSDITGITNSLITIDTNIDSIVGAVDSTNYGLDALRTAINGMQVSIDLNISDTSSIMTIAEFIQTVTDKLNDTLELYESNYRFTESSLVNVDTATVDIQAIIDGILADPNMSKLFGTAFGRIVRTDTDVYNVYKPGTTDVVVQFTFPDSGAGGREVL